MGKVKLVIVCVSGAQDGSKMYVMWCEGTMLPMGKGFNVTLGGREEKGEVP